MKARLKPFTYFCFIGAHLKLFQLVALQHLAQKIAVRFLLLRILHHSANLFSRSSPSRSSSSIQSVICSVYGKLELVVLNC